MSTDQDHPMKVLQLRAQGKTYREIAEELGMDSVQVYRSIEASVSKASI